MESIAWEIGMGVLFAVAYYLLYQQILDHAATRSARDTSLIGGQWLDVLAVLAVIQLGTAFSTRFYWLLLALPLWGAWSLYQTIMGKGGLMGGGGGTADAGLSTESASAAPSNRKQRRADQRTQHR